MRFWKPDEAKAEPARHESFTDYRPRQRVAAAAGDSVVAGGGSVGPFLRRFYRNQVVVSEPVRRFLFFLLLAGVIYAFVLGTAGPSASPCCATSAPRSTGASRNSKAARPAAVGDRAPRERPVLHREDGRERYGYIREARRSTRS